MNNLLPNIYINGVPYRYIDYKFVRGTLNKSFLFSNRKIFRITVNDIIFCQDEIQWIKIHTIKKEEKISQKWVADINGVTLNIKGVSRYLTTSEKRDFNLIKLLG